MRLIDLDAAINALEKIDCSDGVGISALKCDVVDDAVTVIKELPSVDAVPVRHGQWIPCYPLGDDGPEGYMCSVCHIGGWEKTNFCSECGANMDGKVNNG